MSNESLRKIVKSFPSGALESEHSEIDGKSEGLRRRWFESGKVFSETHFANGKPHGTSKEWTEQGIQTLDAVLEDGVLHGPYASWWDDGTPKERGTYIRGERQAGYCWYHPDGSLWRKL